MPSLEKNEILALVRDQGGYIRSGDLRSKGVHPSMLPSMEQDGLLIRIKRGLYALPDNQNSDERFEALMAVHGSILCLGSAMALNGIGTWEPLDIYLALPAGRKVKKPDRLPITIFHFATKTFMLGASEVKVPAGRLQVYDAERTICDLFRLRHRLGSDLAAEALRDYLKRSSRNLPRLLEYAGQLKVIGPLRRSLEALL